LALSPLLRAQGLPEPDLVLYGAIHNVRSGNVRLTAGTLTWRFQPVTGGPVVSVSTHLTNLHDQFSYVLRLPCETPVVGFAASPNTLPLSSVPVQYSRVQVEVDGVPAAFAIPALTNRSVSMADRGTLERIDLLTSAQPPDSDGDGLDDAWECQYFGCNGQAYLDADNDGLTNLAEYQAGTDPTDPQSLFAFIDVQPAPTAGVVLRWSSTPGRQYIILRSNDLLSGFVEIQRDLSATPPQNSFHDPTATGAGPFFYRLRLQEP
jgi:hypothetical protein